MTLAGLEIIKPGTGDVPSDFRCKKPEFAEYLDASAAYDQEQRMGRMYWAILENKVGYTVLAMDSVDTKRQVDLGIDTYGPIPALLIARLATDERYEMHGIGRYLISHALRLANKMSADTGYRIVLANSEPDVVGFYEATGFARFGNGRAHGPGEARHASGRGPNVAGEDDSKYVPMYMDLGLVELRVSEKGGVQGWR